MLQSLVFVAAFLFLGMVSYFIRQKFIRESYCPTMTGNSIMALSLFALGAMSYLPNSLRVLNPYVFMEILVVWLLITESYLKCFLEGHFYIHTRNMLNRLNIGTWAVGTSFLTILAEKNFPEWNEIIWVLAVIAIGIWIEYMHYYLHDLLIVSRKQVNVKINGSIFLGCMSLQSVVLLLNVLLPDYFPIPFSIAMVSLGYVFYVWSVCVFIRSFIQNRANLAFFDWNHANSYLYGALAICGLAALKIAVVPAPIIVVTCCVAILLFLVVESASLKRAIQKRTLEKKYDPTQWSRAFSIGALYLLIVLLGPFQVAFLKPLVVFTTAYGQYLMLALILWEVGQFLKFHIKPPLKKPTPLEE